MKRILFVCHGNICRSPMAEFVMRHLIREAGLADRVSVTSRALHTDELDTHAIPYEKRSAALMTRADYDAYDIIIAMDTENMHDLARLTGGDPKGKVHRLLSYIGESRDVADPWYTGNFDETYRDVDAGCRALLQALAKETP